MTLRYFQQCNTIQELRLLYKKLLKDNYLGYGDKTEVMQEIDKEFIFVCEKFKRAKTKSGATDIKAILLEYSIELNQITIELTEIYKRCAEINKEVLEIVENSKKK